MNDLNKILNELTKKFELAGYDVKEYDSVDHLKLNTTLDLDVLDQYELSDDEYDTVQEGFENWFNNKK